MSVSNKMTPTDWIGLTLIVAPIIFGSVGLAGKIINPALGWISVGLGGGYFLLHSINYPLLWEKKWSQVIAKEDVIYPLLFITIGILGGLNIMSNHALSWTILGSTLLFVVVWVKLCCDDLSSSSKKHSLKVSS